MGMYNVLEKLRANQELTEAGCQIHQQGLVSVLREIHDDLDTAVLDAYGWPANLITEDILYRLVALNEQRSGEERRGLIRWLRPDFQQAPQPGQTGLDIEMEAAVTPASARRPWPASLPERVGAIRAILAGPSTPTPWPGSSPEPAPTTSATSPKPSSL